jgi:hypothetical protein
MYRLRFIPTGNQAKMHRTLRPPLMSTVYENMYQTLN